MEDRDADEMVLVLQGYYRLITAKHLTVEQEKDVWTQDQGNVLSLIFLEDEIIPYLSLFI